MFLTSSHRLYELSNVSTRAQEERAKRPNYRPILENDGLLWKKPHNQVCDGHKDSNLSDEVC